MSKYKAILQEPDHMRKLNNVQIAKVQSMQIYHTIAPNIRSQNMPMYGPLYYSCIQKSTIQNPNRKKGMSQYKAS